MTKKMDQHLKQTLIVNENLVKNQAHQVVWSNRYEIWILIKELNERNPNLSKFGPNFWYDFKNDEMIHIGLIEEIPFLVDQYDSNNNYIKTYQFNTKK